MSGTHWETVGIAARETRNHGNHQRPRLGRDKGAGLIPVSGDDDLSQETLPTVYLSQQGEFHNWAPQQLVYPGKALGGGFNRSQILEPETAQ